MDLNELLYHHQIALMSVSQAERRGHATANFDLPLYYAKRINDYRDTRGLTCNLIMAGGSPRNAVLSGRVECDRYVGDMLPMAQPAILA
ncbi:hypothetical protein V6U71_16405 [Sphingopyxis sp. J-6]|uniref:hypothetical protein n=1 Tax=Sphingopyxis sp. J-6 TaxID=3122054 RepID=UPI0039843E45